MPNRAKAMVFWKKRKVEAERRGLTQAALRNATHDELAKEALGELILTSGADRIGVWLEPEPGDGTGQESAFRGMAWERQNENVPREWRTISPHAVLPLTRLLSGLTVETNPALKGAQPLVGPVAGLHSVLWVPVQHAGKLRGILMAGSQTPSRPLRKEPLQAVAAELTMALAFETERRLASERHSDIALSNRVLASLRENSQPGSLLQEIVESCIGQPGRHSEPGARFAFIGELHIEEREDKAGLKLLYSAEQNAGEQLAQLETVQELAKRALAMKRTIGNEVRLPPAGEENLRVIAVPLENHQESGTALIAGFRAGSASLGSLERMELRGKLAAQVLGAMRERERETQQRQREQAILEANGNPMIVLGPEGSISASNRSARVLLLSHSQATGNELKLGDSPLPARKQFSEFFRMKDRERVDAWQKRQKNEARSAESEYAEAELDCGPHVRLRSQGTGGESQAITLLAADAPASNEEKRARAELLSLAEWLDQGLILFDTEENVRLLNLRFAQLAGLAPGEVKKYKTLEGLVERLRGQSAEPETFAQNWRELARRAEGGEREEIHLLRPAARLLERASRPIFDVGGNRLGRIELYRDLTAQRMFQAKLLQTERLAALGQMVSGVAHELSNPLTSILGYAQRLLLRDDTATHFEEIRRIFAEAERAGAILRRMLLAARESAPERKAVPLNAIVQRTIELQRFSLAAERIHIEVQLEQDLPQIIGDAGQLQQVLMNLLGNARQAIEGQGHGGTIRVRTRRTEDNRVRLEVSDSGPGIPDGILARIFDPFFTTKPAGVGTGLGLSIVLSLVREHGGQVHVQSPRGGGAEFIVELPAAVQKDLQPKALEETGHGSEPARPQVHLRKRSEAQRVLVVEDEPTVAQLISDVLRDEGFEIEIQLDGRDAAERAATGSFDLIICDMKMPNLDGQSLYESLNPGKKRVQGRFLFVTGDVLGAKTHEFLSKNQLPHVAKPFRVEELLEKVHQVLQPAVSVSTRRATPLRKNTATSG